MFSSRLPDELEPNRVSQAVNAARRSGVPLLDLTETNPTAVGISYPPEMLSALSDPRGTRYAPDPRGLASARAVVAAEHLHGRARPVDPERVVLTASTSDAYSALFKLLCNAGDEVLTPQPSYPLFELLTRLDEVVSRPYRLDVHGYWPIDRDSLQEALTPRTRAILVVSPNNPTGSLLRDGDRDWLRQLAADHQIALIGDEVFADYPLAPRADPAHLRDRDGPLVFTLGGLSKSIGLPQAKLAWIVVDGRDDLVESALQRLDMICDTYLSVSTAVQIAAPTLLERGRVVRDAIRNRIARNLTFLAERTREHPAVALLPPEAGWSAVLKLPAIESEEALVLRLIERERVLVHPGYFFDFPSEAFVVVSLLPNPEVFDEAIGRMLPVVAGAR